MVDLAHIVQVKKTKAEAQEKEGWFSSAFTCPNCKLAYGFDALEPSFWKRCSPCNQKLKTWQRAKRWCRLIKERNPYDNVKFITLTIKNPECTHWNQMDPEELKQLIWKPWIKFKRRLLRRGDIKGGVYAYEYTYDEQEWQADLEGFALFGRDIFDDEGSMFEATISHHPHVHIIAVADYLPQKDLLEEWRQCVGHENAGVHIKAIPNTGNALGYVTKYITKSGEAKRRREPFGILRGRE